MAAFVPSGLSGCNYPIETEIQKKFWSSNHKCNRAKAIIAFSYDKENAMRNMRRLLHWRHFWRHRAWNAFGQYVNTPSMEGIPFSEMSDNYWHCMPNDVTDKPSEPYAPTVTITSPNTDMIVGNTYPIVASVTGFPTPDVSWTANGDPIGTGTSVLFTPTEGITYTFEVTATNSEGTATDSQVRSTVPLNLPATFGTWVNLEDTAEGSGYNSDVLWQSKGVPVNLADFDIYEAKVGDVLTGFSAMMTELGSDTTINLYEVDEFDILTTLVASSGLLATPNDFRRWYSRTDLNIPLEEGKRYALAATHDGSYSYPEIGGGNSNVYDLALPDTPVDNPTFTRTSEWCRPIVASVNNAVIPDGGTFECHDLVAAEIVAGDVIGFNASNGSLTPINVLGYDALALEVNIASGFIRFTFVGSVIPFDVLVLRYDGIEYNLPISGSRYQLSNPTLTQQLYDAMLPNIGISSQVCFLGGALPVFISSPDDQTVTAGDSATFEVEVSNYVTLQWQENDPLFKAVWTDMEGETGTSVTIEDTVLEQNGKRYRCVATNLYGQTNSFVGFLYVNPPEGAITDNDDGPLITNLGLYLTENL